MGIDHANVKLQSLKVIASFQSFSNSMVIFFFLNFL